MGASKNREVARRPATKSKPSEVTALFRRALELWPDVSVSRTAPGTFKRNKMIVGRFSWDVWVTDYRPKKPERVRFRARTLPGVLTKVIAEGERRDRALRGGR